MTPTVTIMLADGRTEELPEEQYLTLLALAQEHPDSSWHWADCRCCACFHPGGDLTRGWIVGADGSSEYHEGAH